MVDFGCREITPKLKPHPQTKVEGTEYQENLPNNPGLPSSQINTRMKTTELPHRRMDIWFCFQQWPRTVGTGERAPGQISSEASSLSRSHPFLCNVVALKKQWGESATEWMQQLCSEGELLAYAGVWVGCPPHSQATLSCSYWKVGRFSHRPWRTYPLESACVSGYAWL